MNCHLSQLLLLAFVFYIVGCAETKVADTSPVTEDAALHSEITSEFVQFDTDIDAGRVADFTLTNASGFSLVGFRGSIIGANADGESIYEFPWSKIAIPEIAKPHSKAEIENVGFQIPVDVVDVRLVFKEFDLVK